MYKDYRQSSERAEALIQELCSRNNYITEESTKLKNLLSIETILLADKKLAYTQTHTVINQAKASLLAASKGKISNIKYSAKMPDIKEY